MLLRFQPRQQAGDAFAISRPLASHWRLASCAEVNCPHYLEGWMTLIDEGTSFGQMQGRYLRTQSRRHFREEGRPDGLTAFIFEAGQTCFREHKLPLERSPLFTHHKPTQRLALPFDEWADRFNDTFEKAASRRR